jgi:hypothetical protein
MYDNRPRSGARAEKLNNLAAQTKPLAIKDNTGAAVSYSSVKDE